MQKKILTCPTVKPTLKEFSNFWEYVEKLDNLYSKDFGVVKVSIPNQIVPPKQWRPNKLNYQKDVDNCLLLGPIQQNAYGRGGAYQCLHIQKKSLTVKQYKKKIQCFDKITEGLSSQEIQQLFWKNLAFSPPLYGADIKLTLMDDTAGQWNLGKLKSLLSEGLPHSIQGVDSSYCYIGSWKTLFCWHTQDLQLHAINYLHCGKPKFWYSVPCSQREILNQTIASFFPENFAKCSEFTRHKTLLVKPQLLKKVNPELKICRTVHYAGQFVIVFGGAFHSGFNYGFNIAQAVNFSVYRWLPMLLKAKVNYFYKYCKCVRDSVKINVKQFALKLKESKVVNRPEVQQFIEQALKTKEKNGYKRNKKIKKEKEYKYLWAQCDKCDKWRRIKQNQKVGNHFYCSQVQSICKI